MTDAYAPVLTDEQINILLDRVLRTSGSALKNYTLPLNVENMRTAMRDAERAAIEAYQRQQWISVEDRLPPDDETWVYAMHIDGVPEIVSGCLIHETRPDGAYSHWMPLPPAPDLPTSTVDNPLENPMTDRRQRDLARESKTSSEEQADDRGHRHQPA